MLLPIMYHHVGADQFSNRADVFQQHLEYMKQHFKIVLPGDSLSSEKPNVVLVFDDAAFDFYYYIFPILFSLSIPVVLGIPTRFILDSCNTVDVDVRLSVSTFQMMRGDTYKMAIPFCTWAELREMGSSGLIRFASHSVKHPNLLEVRDFESELAGSKAMIEKNLRTQVDSFIFPYGEFNKEIVTAARQHYRYLFAVGGGDNRTWDGIGGVLFRLYGDDLNDPNSIFDDKHMWLYKIDYYKLRLKKWMKDRQRLEPRD
jgi:peptidoglycan/xylan/chitin deacetylase (PgdA/CDA1 family)